VNRIGKKVLLNQTPTNKKKALIVGDGIGCLMGCPGPAARLKEGNRASLRLLARLPARESRGSSEESRVSRL
jgi:hypothetical protein